MTFKSPWIFFLLPLVTVFVYFFKRRLRQPGLIFSSQQLLGPGSGGLKESLKIFVSDKLIYLRALSVVLILIALAGPRLALENTPVYTEGVDMVLALDSSGSMLAEDFTIGGSRKNRLEVVKQVAAEFISKRPADRIGLVTFAALAYTVCPLTLDHDWLKENLARIEIGAIEDGTAIGSAISSSLSRLVSSRAKSKIVVLLTDGVNNAGKISPLAAAEAAKGLGIRIYTIGVGTRGPVPYPVQDMFGRRQYQHVTIDLDEEVLSQIASVSSGKYYQATDAGRLAAIYEEIDALEKTRMEESGFRQYRELFPFLLLPAMFLIVFEIALVQVWLRMVP